MEIQRTRRIGGLAGSSPEKNGRRRCRGCARPLRHSSAYDGGTDGSGAARRSSLWSWGLSSSPLTPATSGDPRGNGGGGVRLRGDGAVALGLGEGQQRAWGRGGVLLCTHVEEAGKDGAISGGVARTPRFARVTRASRGGARWSVSGERELAGWRAAASGLGPIRVSLFFVLFLFFSFFLLFSLIHISCFKYQKNVNQVSKFMILKSLSNNAIFG